MNRTRLLFSFASALTALTLSLVVSEGVARADDDGIEVAAPAEPSPRADTIERWYGWQTITTDGIALTLGTVGIGVGISSMGSIAPCLDFDGNGCSNRGSSSDPGGLAAAAGLGISAGATYLFAAPIVHASHGHWDKAAMSFGLRALPIALATPLLASGNDDAPRIGLGVLAVGALAAMAVDAAVIAREEVSAHSHEKPRLGVSPTVDAVNKGGGLSVVGTF